jgi:hypothetical protein
MKLLNTTRGTIAAMLVIGVILFSQYNSVGDYTVQGIATFGQADPRFPPMHFNLTLESRNKEYRITAMSLDDTWYNNEITAGDGLDNYYLNQTWPSWDARMKNRGYQEAGTVIEGDFPANSLSIVQLMWLAYCSASHFNIGTNSMTIPLRCTKYAPANGLTEVVSLASSTPNVVDQIQCFGPAFLLALSDKTQLGLKSPYNNGYLLWNLHVTAFTNVGQLTIPISFEYSQFYPNIKYGTNSSDLICLIKAKFEAANVLGEVTDQSLLPMTTRKDVPVFDWRFNKAQIAMGASGQMGTPVVTYKINDGEWRKRDDSGIVSQVIGIRMLVHTRQPAKGGAVVKAFTFSALIVSTLFLVWFIRREIKSNKQQVKN